MVVQVTSLVLGVIVAVVTSPLALPFVGNPVASFINATFTFYFNLVDACILGLSLFKCADRLGINVDQAITSSIRLEITCRLFPA